MQPRLILDISYAELFSIFSPLGQWVDGVAGFRFGQEGAVVCLSARSGFHALLKTLALPVHTPLIFSAITIETMVAIAQEHQLEPCFVDVQPETMLPDPQALDALLAQTQAKVVVIAQLYGCVSSLQAHSAVCKKHGALLVEDCAQAFSGNFHLGDAAADYSLFSFGPIKRCTALGGGVIVGNNAAILKTIESLFYTWPRKTDTWFIRRALKFMALKIASVPLVYSGLLGLLSALGKDADAFIGSIARGFQAGAITPQLEYRPSPRQLRLLQRRLKSAQHSEQRKLSAQNALAQAQRLFPTPFARLGLAAQKNAYWLNPVLVADGADSAAAPITPTQAIALLRQHGMDATRGATSMRAFGDAQQCPHAHRIMQQVVYLPLMP